MHVPSLTGWLHTAKALSDSGTAFVLATVWRKSGYSPDDVGGRLLVTDQSMVGTLNSGHRRNRIGDRARQLLLNNAPDTIESYPLGDILGSQNGTYEVLYCVFSARQRTPLWLSEACDLQQQGVRFVLSQQFNADQPGAASWKVITANSSADEDLNQTAGRLLKRNPAPDFTETLDTQDHCALLQVIGEPLMTVCLLGDSQVAICLAAQLRLLPVALTWYVKDRERLFQGEPSTSLLQEFSPDAVPAHTRIVIATGHHESDYQFCEQALLADHIDYVGCIGSEKKASLIKTRLQHSLVPPHRLAQLHVPIGWQEITGKQPSIVAASIVAQLLSYR